MSDTSRLRSTARRLAHWSGFSVTHRSHVGRRFLDHPPSSAFDLILLHCYPELRKLNFIQIGANDGQRADPIARYLESCAWSGLMFEPLTANHAALVQRHRTNPCLTIRRAAVDTVTGRRTMYDVDRRRYPNLPIWAYGLGSFSRDRVVTAVRELGLDVQAVVSEEIEAITWREIWRDFGPRRCDILVLDTEGYDLTLLRAAGLSDARPRLIHFEHACVDLSDRLAFYHELISLGYELATDGPDTTAWLRA